MCRCLLWVVFVSVLLCSAPRLISQEVQVVEEFAAPEVQQTEDEQALRAYEMPDRMKPDLAILMIKVVVYGAVLVVLVMFLLIAYFHEPSASQKPYEPTEVRRGANYKPWRPHQEQKTERHDIGDI